MSKPGCFFDHILRGTGLYARTEGRILLNQEQKADEKDCVVMRHVLR